LVEGVDVRRVQVGPQLHVGLVDRLPAGDRGAVEHGAIGEEVLIDHVDVEGDVLHLAAHVGEADVDIFDVLLFDFSQDILVVRHGVFDPL
jgi:hypothetical protein